MKSNLISAIVIFVLAIAGSLTAFGQTDSGRIAGKVSDANGAVIPGASVTVTNVGTSEKRTATTNTEKGNSALMNTVNTTQSSPQQTVTIPVNNVQQTCQVTPTVNNTSNSRKSGISAAHGVTPRR